MLYRYVALVRYRRPAILPAACFGQFITHKAPARDEGLVRKRKVTMALLPHDRL